MPQDKDELLQVLITQYTQMYMKLAYAIGVPFDDVEDIVMEAFWSFYRADYGGKLEIIADFSAHDPLQAVISRESCGQIYEILDGLRESWKDVTVMYFIQGLTTEEICERLEITNDMCRSRISRARKYLREELQSRIDKGHL